MPRRIVGRDQVAVPGAHGAVRPPEQRALVGGVVLVPVPVEQCPSRVAQFAVRQPPHPIPVGEVSPAGESDADRLNARRLWVAVAERAGRSPDHCPPPGGVPRISHHELAGRLLDRKPHAPTVLVGHRDQIGIAGPGTVLAKRLLAAAEHGVLVHGHPQAVQPICQPVRHVEPVGDQGSAARPGRDRHRALRICRCAHRGGNRRSVCVPVDRRTSADAPRPTAN